MIRVRLKSSNKFIRVALPQPYEISPSEAIHLSQDQFRELVEKLTGTPIIGVSSELRELVEKLTGTPIIGVSSENSVEEDIKNFQYIPERYEDTSLDIELDDEFDHRLTILSNELGLPKEKLLHSGIALLEMAIQAKKEGLKFGAVEKDQPLVSEVVGL